MRNFLARVGLLLIMAGFGLGLMILNHYFRWVDLPFGPSAYWPEVFVVPSGEKPTQFENVVKRPKPPPPTDASRDLEVARSPTGRIAAGRAGLTGSTPEEPDSAAVDVKMLPWGLKHPKAMQEGRVEEVRFVIDGRANPDPAQALAASKGTLVAGQTPAAATYAAQALGGRCFRVEPTERIRVAFSETVPMVWTWVVTAEEAHDDCILTVYVGAIEDDQFVPLRLEQVSLPVETATLRDLLGLAGPIDDVLSLIALGSTIFGLLMTWVGVRRRR